MKFIIRYKGGKGSGNFGHAGREGHLGGSAPSGGSDSGWNLDKTSLVVNSASENMTKMGHTPSVSETNTHVIISSNLAGSSSKMKMEYRISKNPKSLPLRGNDGRTILYNKEGKVVGDWEGIRPIRWMAARKVAKGEATLKWDPEERYGEYKYMFTENKR